MSYILPATWARVERLYFEGEVSLADIAVRCGISRSSLRNRVVTKGWPSHRTLELDGGSSERARLRRAIANKLTRLEKRMDKPDTDNATDSERQTREFGSLMATVDKLDSKEGAWKRSLLTTPAEENSTTADEGNTNVEHWRAELAQRIARLGARRHGG